MIGAAAMGALAILGGGAWWIQRANPPRSAQLSTPILALGALQAQSLYYNGPARPWLAKHRPDLLQHDDARDGSPRARSFAQATQNSKLFRQLDRALRFDTLLLVGDPTQYRPLLEHLLETRDWTLSYLDHTSLIYRRAPARAWEPADLATLRQQFHTPREQALFLAQAATKMIALRMIPAADGLLAEAEKIDARIPDLWHARAVARMHEGNFPDALLHVDRALALDPRSLPALGTKTQILYSTKKISEAFALSARLIDARPEDPALLFYHAKIAHDAHAFRDEIATLEKLVAVAEREGQSTSAYRIYLAQAYAADGQAEPSIAQFNRVLADSDLSGEQRRFAEETVAQIKQRAGL